MVTICLLCVKLRAKGVNRGLPFVVTLDLSRLPKRGQKSSGTVERNPQSVSNFSTSGFLVLSEEVDNLLTLGVLFQLGFGGLRGTIGIALGKHLNLVVNESNLLSINKVLTDSSKHLSLGHRDSSFCDSIAYNGCYQILMPFSSDKAFRGDLSLTFCIYYTTEFSGCQAFFLFSRKFFVGLGALCSPHFLYLLYQKIFQIARWDFTQNFGRKIAKNCAKFLLDKIADVWYNRNFARPRPAARHST